MKKIILIFGILLTVFLLTSCGCEHQYEENITTEPTCTSVGTKTFTCTLCNDTYSEEIPIVEHSFGLWKITKNATCTTEGESQRTCKCGKIESKKLPVINHSYGDWTTIKESTCTEKGEAQRTCKCGATESKALPTIDHSFSEWITTKAATCTTKGEAQRTCKCGKVESKVLPVTSHSFGKWTTTKEATCTVSGEKQRVCVCGKVETQSVTSSHSWKNATCTQPKTCSKCGKTTGSVAQHSWKNATCTQSQTCSVCGTSGMPALGHTYLSGKCDRCGVSAYKITYNKSQYVECTYTFNSTGRVEFQGAGFINNVSYEDGKLKLTVKISVNGTFGCRYKIYDSNGNIVKNSYFIKSNCLAGDTMLLTQFIGSLPYGEYKITFSSYDYGI